MLDSYAGAGGLEVITSDTCVPIDPDFPQNTKAIPIRAISVLGNSMEPYIKEGDRIYFALIKKNEQLRDDVYVIETNQGLQIKALKFYINGSIDII